MRARQTLQDLTHLGYAGIDTTRELILDARGIEAILTPRAPPRNGAGPRYSGSGQHPTTTSGITTCAESHQRFLP